MKAYKQGEIKYYKYIIQPWTRPNLTQDGTWFVDDFAVNANRANGNYVPAGFGAAWRAFDGSSSTGWGSYSQDASQHYVTMYSKLPLCITQMNLTFATASCDTKGHTHTYVLVSKDNINYIQIHDEGSTSSKTVNLTINNSGYYNFYRLDIRTPGGDDADGIALAECAITATSKQIVEGTDQDYDFIVKGGDYYTPKINNIYYALKSWEKGQYYGS